MRSLNEVMLAAGDASGDLISDPVGIEYQFGISIQAIITGAPVGNMLLQGSNDFGKIPPGGPVIGQGVVNWTDITSSTAAVSGAGSVVWNYRETFFKWIRVTYDATSGTGNITITANSKSV